MQYFITPNHNIALNNKVGTNAIAEAIIETYYPDRVPFVAHNIDGYEIDNMHDYLYRSLVDQTDTPDKPVLLLVREPVERFLSACAMFYPDVEEALERLESPELDVHFQKQSDFVTSGTAIFKFPEQLGEFCKEAGFDSLPVRHEGGEKPELTDEQRKKVEEFYKDDIALYNKL